MTMLINKSIEEGKVPLILKKEIIIPLYKKGPSNICGNYKPVSLLPSLSKNLEKAICHCNVGGYFQTEFPFIFI